jgi:phosphoribosyl-ATP pyrophosphohydrolase
MSIYDLERLIDERAHAKPAGSYTVRLLDEGIEKCAKKTGEEAVEFAIAAVAGNRKSTIGEAADLVYHLLVTLSASDITLIDVEKELTLRHEQKSGKPKSDHRGT